MITNWAEITREALISLWQGFLYFIPSLIGAIIILTIGWIIAIWVGRIFAEVLRKLKIDKVFRKEGWKKALEKADIKVDVAEFIGAIIKWTLIVVFLKIAVEILGWDAFVIFLGDVIAYLPNVIVAVLIFVVTAIIVDIFEKIVGAGTEGIKEGYGQIVGMTAKWAIWIFAILAILHQLGIAPVFMRTLFTGIIAMLAISFGLAFGLGGKDVAGEILQDLKKKLKE